MLLFMDEATLVLCSYKTPKDFSLTIVIRPNAKQPSLCGPKSANSTPSKPYFNLSSSLVSIWILLRLAHQVLIFTQRTHLFGSHTVWHIGMSVEDDRCMYLSLLHLSHSQTSHLLHQLSKQRNTTRNSKTSKRIIKKTKKNKKVRRYVFKDRKQESKWDIVENTRGITLLFQDRLEK